MKQQIRYGTHRSQQADLWRPDTIDGRAPVVVLIHGGFWKAPYTKRLMNRLAASIVANGWVAYNVEYRRVGRLGGGGGWPATFEDVSAAIDRLADIDDIDPDQIVTCGHSAGGALALWAGARWKLPAGVPGHAPRIRVRAAVSLAGVVDLDRAATLGLGKGAVAALLGGDHDEHPDRYRYASPAALLPLDIPQVLVHGLDDTTVAASMSADYVRSASASGDDAVYVPLAGLRHVEMINPSSEAWKAVLHSLRSWFAT